MTYFKSGTWNMICAICGTQCKSDEILKRWDGLFVCKDDFEVRHIADFIRAIPERGAVPFTAPESDDNFIYICYLEASQGRANVGEADCARADISLPIYTY